MLNPATRLPLVLNLSIALAGVLLVAVLAAWPPAARGEAAEAAPPSAAAEEEKEEENTAAPWQEAIKTIGAALAISLTAFATAFTQCRIGSAGVGALAENPKLFGNILIFLVVPETMVILGFVIAALMLF